ncbi:hypothetical protein RBU61_15825 [Tissierella sp. MB52-C2]|uniref:hypothetical protein n=1 Tax=Tissierella sp. MB52-C2 TaxID=3070999 RepID=UPI00280A981B|nr:hypothetical protein [Tissierella sp. MB52-C2]WMM24382.1 hypothetical protein RBU61_15825 [Tissierella sp. MB52-C2]
MPSSLAYTRKFIILKKEFSNIGGNPKGHCKLEIKGIRGLVTVNIENAEKDKAYNVVFVLNDSGNNVWNLGKIFTDELGKGKGEYVFLQQELEKENLFLDKISGILIVRDGKVLLGGYLDQENGTIQRYIDTMPLSPIIESKEEPKEEKIEVEEVEESIEVEKIEKVEQSSVVEEVIEIQEIEETQEIQETKVVEEVQEVEKETIEEPEEEVCVEPKEEVYTESIKQEYNPIYDIPAKEQEIEPIYHVPAQEMEYNPLYDIPAREPEYNPKYDIPAKEPVAEALEEEAIEELMILEEEVQELEVEELEENIEETVVGLDADDEDDEDDFEPDYKTLDYMKKLNQKNQTTNYVLSILRFFPYIEPFKYKLKGYNWWIVELDKENEYRAFLPYFSYIIGGNNKEFYRENTATCSQLMDKYQHYLFGLYNEGENVKYFVYGIPGKFMREEHPYVGEREFNTWYEGINAEGYWIIHIDPMTGKPVDSPVSMMPTD